MGCHCLLQEHHRGDVFFSGLHIRGRRYYALITSGVNFDLLIKVVSAGLPHYKIIFPFEINKYFREDTLALYIPYSP